MFQPRTRADFQRHAQALLDVAQPHPLLETAAFLTNYRPATKIMLKAAINILDYIGGK